MWTASKSFFYCPFLRTCSVRKTGFFVYIYRFSFLYFLYEIGDLRGDYRYKDKRTAEKFFSRKALSQNHPACKSRKHRFETRNDRRNGGFGIFLTYHLQSVAYTARTYARVYYREPCRNKRLPLYLFKNNCGDK